MTGEYCARQVHHEAVEVVEAVVDNAHFSAMVVDTHTLHTLLLTMQNTRQQYLELTSMPVGARVMSLFVNSIPTKPVKGTGDALLVPLLVGTPGQTCMC